MFLYCMFFIINICFSLFSNGRSDLILYKDFDPSNNHEYCQVLRLMRKNKLLLLDPQEDPKAALNKYCEALAGSAQKGYEGLRVKVLKKVSVDGSADKIVGFVSYLEQGKNNMTPLYVGTIAIDSEFQGMGFGSALMSKLEQDAVTLGKKGIFAVVYSNNETMLRLLQRRNYTVNFKDKPCFGLKDTKTNQIEYVSSIHMIKFFQPNLSFKSDLK